ncbi:hypothetical protein BD413DRAFT_195940 [Trametes elegans]|nr:hypothetical protein BD413DRAFT_195940 [Trametes elegans]
MSDEILRHCISGFVVCLLEAGSGICNDFWTIRHPCVESICLRCSRSPGDGGDPEERQALIQPENVQPSAHPPMQRPTYS